MFVIVSPNISPVLLSLGPLKIHWYSLAYIIGILFGWFYSKKLTTKFDLGITVKNLEDFVTWSLIGIVLGGRLGYVLFYDPMKYFSQPLDILKTYEGGMSFHGGITGLILAAYLFSRKYKINFFSLADLMALVSPLGLFLGRIANFINAELYGRVTNVSWAVIFPNSDMQPRHPSQLYEAVGEGLILFIVMNYLAFRYKILKIPSLTSGIFLIIYSIFRIVIENFREPDFHIGLIGGKVTMGQILSLPMLLLGIYLLCMKRLVRQS